MSSTAAHSFAPQLPEDYNPATSRLLLEASQNAIEIENAFNVSKPVIGALFRHAEKRGLTFMPHVTNSLYLDTPQLAMYGAGKTLRLRPGTVAKCSVTSAQETFPNQFSMKTVHGEFNRTAYDIATRLATGTHDFLFYPKIRSEFEGKHAWPKQAVQLRHIDLPNEIFDGHQASIAHIVRSDIWRGKIEGVSKPNNLILVPYVLTVVDRKRITLFVTPGGEYDFKNVWPATEPTEAMRESGKYMAMELAIDRCAMYVCPENSNIDNMARATEAELGHKLRLGKRLLLEYEVKGDKCGPSMSDLDLVKTYIEFGKRMQEFAGSIGGRLLVPSASKGTTTFGMHPKCASGVLASAYQKARAFAP